MTLLATFLIRRKKKKEGGPLTLGDGGVGSVGGGECVKSVERTSGDGDGGYTCLLLLRSFIEILFS